MPRHKPLTAVQVSTIRKPGFHHDPQTVGLYLQVAKGRHGVTRSWCYRYNSPINGKLRWLGLGSAEIVSLADARKLAYELRRTVRIGKRDPVQERLAARAEAVKATATEMSFAQCCDAYLAQHAASWKNDKHRHQWRSTLDTACEAIGKLTVGSVETGAIVKLLTPIWQRTPETGSRLRSRIERVLDWAAAGELRAGPNPARWDGHLEFLLKARPKRDHHKAMPWRDVPAFMAMLRERESVSARALEFAILTAARTGEVIGAKWDEFDLKARVWTVPADRMKAGIEHKVPLSERALAILKNFPMSGSFVFPGAKPGAALSNMSMLELLRGTAGNGFTVHGFRSCFKDWAGESTAFARDIIEFALAHKLPDRVESAYRRETAVEKRRRLMAEWAGYCESSPVDAENVVPLRA
jgi:integrase